MRANCVEKGWICHVIPIEVGCVTWYSTEGEREVNFPTLRGLNQQVPRTD